MKCVIYRCQHGAKCNPSANYETFACECSLGYKGHLCHEDVDECSLSAPCRNGATCRNTPGSYQCLCTAGYEGPDCLINTDDCASCKFSFLYRISLERFYLLDGSAVFNFSSLIFQSLVKTAEVVWTVSERILAFVSTVSAARIVKSISTNACRSPARTEPPAPSTSILTLARVLSASPESTVKPTTRTVRIRRV